MSKQKDSTKVPRSKARTAYGLLSEIRTLILEEPKRYNQRTTLEIHKPGVNDGLEFPPCGTIGCVAGWTAALVSSRPGTIVDVLMYATKKLGLTSRQESELFTSLAAGIAIRQTREHARDGAAHIARFQKKYRAQLQAKRIAVRS